MRNLKKFLALVLAMMMTLSLMVTVNAADSVSDLEDVTTAFQEGVQVLDGMNVIKGFTDGTFGPKKDVTRAQMAAFIYRIVTGDVKDERTNNYAGYNSKFTDVEPTAWYAGYIGFCENAGYIQGYGNNTFGPDKKVTGIQALVMILRAMGYNEPGHDFTGTGWQTQALTYATNRNLLVNVNNTTYGGTLSKNATRELIAELVFEGLLQTRVQWTAAYGYQTYDHVTNDALWGDQNWDWDAYSVYAPLGWKNFEMEISQWKAIDKWGNPGYEWTYKTGNSKTTISADPVQTYTTTKKECEVAEDLGIKTEETYKLYVNNDDPVTDSYRIVATDTVTKVGGYGRLTNVYKGNTRNWSPVSKGVAKSWPVFKSDTVYKTVTMVDTIVAKVLDKTDAVLDGAGHVIVPAKLTVNLYDDAVEHPTRRTIQKPTASKDNWDDFATGDVLCMNGVSDTGDSKNERHAFETNVLTKWGTNKEKSPLIDEIDVFNITRMSGTPGKLTKGYGNLNKHDVDGEPKDDALTLKLDKASDNVNTTYIWYYDQYGYVQAIDVAGASYGVITAVYAAFGTGDANTSTTGTAKAIATVQFSNGDIDTVEIDRFLVKGNATAGTDGTAGTKVTTTAATMTEGTKFASGSDSNAIELWPVYDTKDFEPLDADPKTGLTPALISADANGFLYMAPTANSNLISHNAGNDVHGILFDNLFKFVRTANDQMVAVEVAGNASASNTGIYADHHSELNANTSAGKIWKGKSCVSTNSAASAGLVWIDNDTQILVRDKDKNIIKVYNGVSDLPGDVTIEVSGTASTQNAFFTSEIDWADTDNDGRAEIVYVTGKIDGQTTYGLFYYNGGTWSWDGKTGTLDGWLGGERTTLTFDSYALWNTIRNAANTAGTEEYKGHLFAVEQFMGTVTDVMERHNGKEESQTSDTDLTHWSANLLMNGSGSTFINKTGEVFTDDSGANFENAIYTSGLTSGSTAHNGATFKTGGVPGTERYGNDYTTSTQAVYFEDTNLVTITDYQLVWTPEVVGTAGTISVYIDGAGSGIGAADGKITVADLVSTYYVNPNTKVWGIGKGAVLATGEVALQFLNKTVRNDVTMVYETTAASTFTVKEIYIATDSDITPTDPGTTGDVAPVIGGDLIKGPEGTGATTDNAALAALIKTNLGKVIFTRNGASVGGLTDFGNEDILWIPAGYYTSSLASSNPKISLTITHKSTGAVVMVEELTTAAGYNFFYLATNGTGTTIVDSSAFDSTTGILKPGDYHFQVIDVTAGKTTAEGDFSMG